MFATHMLMKRSSQNRFGVLRQLHAKQSRDQLLHLARLHLSLDQNQRHSKTGLFCRLCLIANSQ